MKDASKYYKLSVADPDLRISGRGREGVGGSVKTFWPCRGFWRLGAAVPGSGTNLRGEGADPPGPSPTSATDYSKV